MIRVNNISHSIKGTPILQDVSFELPAGQVIALIGPNGAGKSTLFSLMARLQFIESKAKQSRIQFGKHDIHSADSNTLAKTVSMLSQENHIQSRLRVKELLMFGRYPYHQGQPTPNDFEQVNRVIQQFELEPLADKFLSDLSGGQKQRVLIAMVICQDTPYILLDEPLNNLDMYHANKLMRILKELTTASDHHSNSNVLDNNSPNSCNVKPEKTIVIVLHDINQASQFADTVVMMKDGRLITTGTPNEVVTKDNILALFGVEVDVLMHKGKPFIISDI